MQHKASRSPFGRLRNPTENQLGLIVYPHYLRWKKCIQTVVGLGLSEPKNRMTSEISRCNHDDCNHWGSSIREAKATWLNHAKHDISAKAERTKLSTKSSEAVFQNLSSSAQLGPSSLRKSISRAFVRSKAASWTALIGGSSRIFLMPSCKNMMDAKQHRSQKIDTNTYYMYIYILYIHSGSHT